MNQIVQKKLVAMQIEISMRLSDFKRSRFFRALSDDRGDVPDDGLGLPQRVSPL